MGTSILTNGWKGKRKSVWVFLPPLLGGRVCLRGGRKPDTDWEEAVPQPLTFTKHGLFP